MDATQCFREMHEHAVTAYNAQVEAVLRAQDLLGWLDRGGFPPDGLTAEQARERALAVIDQHGSAVGR